VQRTRLRRHDQPYEWRDDYYDELAYLSLQLITTASQVTTKESIGWNIQYNAIWSRLFNFDTSKTRKIVLFKLRRLLYEEVRTLEDIPNFQNGALLGYLLNVFGPALGPKQGHRRDEYPLRRVVLAWTHRNYLWLAKRQPKAANAALLGTITFDARKKRLVKTYREGLSKKPAQDFLDLDPTRANEFKRPAAKKQKAAA
jgi:hypothetical protein